MEKKELIEKTRECIDTLATSAKYRLDLFEKMNGEMDIADEQPGTYTAAMELALWLMQWVLKANSVDNFTYPEKFIKRCRKLRRSIKLTL